MKTYIDMFEAPILEELDNKISGHCQCLSNERWKVQPISVSLIKEEGTSYPYKALVVFQEVEDVRFRPNREPTKFEKEIQEKIAEAKRAAEELSNEWMFKEDKGFGCDTAPDLTVDTPESTGVFRTLLAKLSRKVLKDFLSLKDR